MSFELLFLEEAKKDYDKLDNSQKIHVNKSFQKIKAVGGQAGEALRGRLKGYRKIKHRRLGLRVIFRQLEDRIEIIEIVAIGKRSDNEIYQIAESRIQ
ncbi:TPA: type II toxin-antitoxin system RelE/ParE family toxin [Streptococcus suis]|nr:type II toxin-antitoxin system RelE/ParE family toxin [Streptococcus suis]HEL2095962.1 type II toxin-antitoxin system RelE/ParE family toxin [Streptococcus suis]HEM3613005.1 type II toxin-antitoxin system RelE/ParE family toxin [Streptococcus suis]HEM3613668.1 type II toxin-antitoxin system RelE/ParE family toxin [Streptococcus suis]HEM3623102.1 type II toxin-antitoxin system RelE/ParE family toxin [Streptococcus suis]